jgi:hypothetical protein
VFSVLCVARRRKDICRAGRGGGGGGSLEPRTSDRVLVLIEGFLGELKLVLDLVEGFLEKLKLVLVLVELFGLLVQQLCTTAHFVGFKTISKAPRTAFCRIKLCIKDQLSRRGGVPPQSASHHSRGNISCVREEQEEKPTTPAHGEQ